MYEVVKMLKKELFPVDKLTKFRYNVGNDPPKEVLYEEKKPHPGRCVGPGFGL